jgi:RNA polymerase sigma-70 factor (ECF subfamily)
MTRGAPVDVEPRILELLDAGDDRGAATEIVRALGPQILGYLHATLRDEDAAQDAFAQFTEDLWSGLASFRRECPVRVWAWRLAWHAAARTARDPYRNRGRRFATGEMSELAAAYASVPTAVWTDERSAKLDALRAALDPEERTLLILRVDKQMPWSEVAEVLSTAEAPVDAAALRKRFERIKAKLAEHARAQGLVE